MTGQGIDAAARRISSRRRGDPRAIGATARFRLAVDRVFTLAGVGVVVTGTVLSGSVRLGDHVQLSPSGLSARVRSMHAQNSPAEIGAGRRPLRAQSRPAPDISKDAIRRGDVVLDPALARADRSHRRRPARAAGGGKADRAMVSRAPASCRGRSRRAHRPARRQIASARRRGRRPARSRSADRRGVPDRFVIRDVSAQRTHRRRQVHRSARAGPEAAHAGAACAARRVGDRRSAGVPSRRCLATPPFASISQPSRATGRFPPSRSSGSRRTSDLTFLKPENPDGSVAAPMAVLRLRACTKQVAAYHAENPDLQGIGREQLRLMLQPRLPKPAFAVALAEIAAKRRDRPRRRLRPPAVTSGAARAERRGGLATIAPLLGGDERFRPPRVRDIAAATGHAERDVRRLLKLAGRLGWVDEVAHDHFFLRETVREMVAIAADVAATGREQVVHRRRTFAIASTTAARSRSRFWNSSTGTA